ncbi:hypothetical protein [Streptomyces sp. NBC_00035]|uniref:hypothetical protein n=1 Tax=Streptomyces sp. NBC_00035 TaxID=2903614 RepID=UPI00325300FC
MADGRIPPVVIRGLTALLALTALGGFVAVSFHAISASISAQGSAPKFNDAYLYVTTALSTLVGGVVALGFGQKPPSNDDNPPLPVTEAVEGLSAVVTGKKPADVGAWIGAAYAILYVLLGIVAIILWMVKPDLVADPVKALASTFLGLALPIARGYFA